MATSQPSTSLEPTEEAETTRYPAGDHSLSAPEHDHAVIAPQVAVDHGPEVYYDDTSPEATNGSEKETVDRSVPRTVPKSFWRKKGNVIIATLSILIAVVIVVGSVVGTAKAKKSSNTSSSSDPPVSTLVSTISRSSPQPTAFPKSDGILNDSSFAALTLQNNDRRLFYQDQKGVIKQAIFSDATKHWNAAFSNVVPSNARNHTPFAVLSIRTNDDELGGLVVGNFNKNSEAIYLFYISTNNTLAITLFRDGIWTGLATERIMTHNISTATDSRYLSVTKISRMSSFQVCLFHEDLNGKVNALRGLWVWVTENETDIEPMNVTTNATAQATGPSDLRWAWEDNTRKLRATLRNYNFTLSAPFSSSVSPNGGVLAIFSNLKDDDTYGLNAFSTDYLNDTFSAGSQHVHEINLNRSTAPFDLLQIPLTEGEDPLLFWVNGTELEIQLVYLGPGTFYNPGPSSGPKTGFPYSRLGGTVSYNATAYYLYHQIDDLTIAEEKWSSETGLWDSSNITVGTY